MEYRVVFDTNLSPVEKSGQFPLEILVIIGTIIGIIALFSLFSWISCRKRINKVETEFSLLKSKVNKVHLTFLELASKFSNRTSSSREPPPKSKKLTESDIDRIADIMISKAPVKINRDRLKELIAKGDIKALAKALKMSISEVEILFKL